MGDLATKLGEHASFSLAVFYCDCILHFEQFGRNKFLRRALICESLLLLAIFLMTALECDELLLKVAG